MGGNEHEQKGLSHGRTFAECRCEFSQNMREIVAHPTLNDRFASLWDAASS